MIVSKSVEMVWNNRVKKHYESLGYIFTKNRDIFNVDVADLMPTSTLMVDVKCEICGALRKVKYYIALPREKDGNPCIPCALKLANPKIAVAKREKRGSFLDEAIERFGDDFLEKYWSDKNILDPSQLCRGGKVRIWVKCQKVSYHDDYQVTCKSFLSGGRCPQCYNTSVHPLDSLGEMMNNEYGERTVEARWSKKNNTSPFECHTNSNKKFWFTCPDGIHDDYLQIANCARIAEFRCPQCTRESKKSRLQSKVESYIQSEYGYEMLHEGKCTLHPKNPFTGQTFRYDIEIESLSLIIEVNGAQHYKLASMYSKFHTLKTIKTPEEELQYQQMKDEIKKRYAIQHGYTFLEIPYTSERGNTYKQLIDDAINTSKKSISA